MMTTCAGIGTTSAQVVVFIFWSVIIKASSVRNGGYYVRNKGTYKAIWNFYGA